MTEQAKHTPEPWMPGWTKNTWAKVYQGVKGEYGGRTIAHILPIHANGARQAGDFAQEEANSRLIAAAPSLLRALEDLTSEIKLGKLNIRKDFSLINAHAAATKAIRQATGE